MSIPQSTEIRSEAHGTTKAASITSQGVKRKRDISDVGGRASETVPKHTTPKPTFQKPERRKLAVQKPKGPKPTVEKHAAPEPAVPSTPKRLKSTKTKPAKEAEPDIYIDWNIHVLSTPPDLTPQERAHFDAQMMPPPGIAASATPKRKRPKMHFAIYQEWDPPSPSSLLAVARRNSLTQRYNTERAPWLQDPNEAVNGGLPEFKIAKPDEKKDAESKVRHLLTANVDGVAAHIAQSDTSRTLKQDALESADLAGVPEDLVDQ